jgi:hypothetical protein
MEHYFYSRDPETGKILVPVIRKDWETAALLAVADNNGYIPYSLYTVAMAQIIKIREQNSKQN